MKKTIFAILVVLIFTMPVFAANGDIAGEIYSTDIVTYMSSAPVTSYNIGGKTCIDAEILNWHYGFDVYWYEAERHLDITDKGDGFVSLQAMSGELVENKAAKPGSVVGNYYKTDITVTLNGNPIESYNIGGRTMICAEAMAESGYNVDWNEENRTLAISKPMDFYKYTTDYGEIKSSYDFKLPRNRLVFYKRGVNVTVGEEIYELAIPSGCVYVSPGGVTYMKLSDLVSVLGGECEMTQTQSNNESRWVNVAYDTPYYAYTFNLIYDKDVNPELTKADEDASDRADITGEGLYAVELLTASLTVNGEPYEVKAMYGGKEFNSALKVVQGEVYIPIHNLAKLLGYDFAW